MSSLFSVGIEGFTKKIGSHSPSYKQESKYPNFGATLTDFDRKIRPVQSRYPFEFNSCRRRIIAQINKS